MLFFMNKNKMTAEQWKSLVGSKISHLGCEGTIESVRPDMGMMAVAFDDGRRAIMRPSDIR